MGVRPHAVSGQQMKVSCQSPPVNRRFAISNGHHDGDMDQHE
jgi:hypothetical protein